MRKSEFLNILRQSLEGEIDSYLINQNINYFDQYIGTQTIDEEERIINELGDPRLIAKTIIEAQRAARGRRSDTDNRYYQKHDFNDDRRAYDNHTNTTEEYKNNGFKIKWYHKLILLVILIILFAVIIFVGRILISLLLVFGIPIILILLMLYLFRKR